MDKNLRFISMMFGINFTSIKKAFAAVYDNGIQAIYFSVAHFQTISPTVTILINLIDLPDTEDVLLYITCHFI